MTVKKINKEKKTLVSKEKNKLNVEFNFKNKKERKYNLNLIKSFFSTTIGKLAGILLVLVLISGIAFGTYYQITNSNDSAKAGLNCPTGSKPNDTKTGCVSTTPSDYLCPNNWTAGGGNNPRTECWNNEKIRDDYSCLQGGDVSGVNCVASNGNPVKVNPPNCPAAINNTPNNGIWGGVPTCLHNYLLEGGGLPLNIVQTGQKCSVSGWQAPPEGFFEFVIDGIGVCSVSYWGANGGKAVRGMFYGGLTQNYSYAATSNPVNGWVNKNTASTPIYATTSPTGYTIDISTTILNCTPNKNDVIARDKFDCTFNLSGSPTGTYSIPSEGLYAGIINSGRDLDTLLGRSDLCTTSGSTLTCNNIPTTGASVGIKGIVLQQGINFAKWYFDKGAINIVIPPTVDSLFIPDTSLTILPNPSTGLSVFGDKDYSITIKDDRMVTTPTQSLNSSTASCTFRIKELTSPTDDNAERGWDKLTSTIISPFTSLGNDIGDYKTTSKLFEVPYNTNGVSIKILKTNQKYSDYDLEIRCIRTSDNQVYSRDEKINFLFGAYAAVGISGVVVPV